MRKPPIFYLQRSRRSCYGGAEIVVVRGGKYVMMGVFFKKSCIGRSCEIIISERQQRDLRELREGKWVWAVGDWFFFFFFVSMRFAMPSLGRWELSIFLACV